ncbi:MAG: response regulator transcription factor [Anaerolineaceae bacterium]
MTIHIFLADDHSIIRDGLSALLQANPEMQVVGDAANGLQAVEKVLALKPDVVIMDISMPGLNGILATQQILDNLPGTHVIILSMLGENEYLFQALKAGAQGYLLKESAGREVLEAVFAVQAGKIYLSQPVLKALVEDYLYYRSQGEKKRLMDLLSQREREVLQHVVEGKTSAAIAELLFLSPKTVESYRSRIMHKLSTPDLPSLIKYAIKENLFSEQSK